MSKGTLRNQSIRPTKKQRELLSYIDKFINEHGYSPSFREIMRGCGYGSVATVAAHIDNLIARGHLEKRDNEARSLEVVDSSAGDSVKSNKVSAKQEKWLIQQIDYYFGQVEQARRATGDDIDRLYVLVGALKVMGLDGAAQSFIPRLSSLKYKSGES
ncbi:MAG: hypothetical protein M3P98_01345 [bacterium]|nr:hypothetical protein [bacterium]